MSYLKLIATPTPSTSLKLIVTPAEWGETKFFTKHNAWKNIFWNAYSHSQTSN